MARLSKQQQEEIRLKIIKTAVELFSEHGFEATTMKQIAREAGIGDATIRLLWLNGCRNCKAIFSRR